MKTQLLITAFVAALPLCAQMQDNQDRSMACKDSGWGGNAHFCEIREQRIPASGKLTVDGGQNGGVAIKGWSGSDILVRAKVETNAPTESEAQSEAGQIRLSVAGGQVKADGPSFGNNRGWSVSYEVFVPHALDVTLKAHNGGVSVVDVRGDISFTTVNGGVSLKRLAGTVHGQTENGGVHVEFMGDRWDGSDFDVKTQNGGVHMSVPANYNARLETSTVNGHVSVDFPVTVSGNISRALGVNLGNGGPRVRVTTVNGGVKIQKT